MSRALPTALVKRRYVESATMRGRLSALVVPAVIVCGALGGAHSVRLGDRSELRLGPCTVQPERGELATIVEVTEDLCSTPFPHGASPQAPVGSGVNYARENAGSTAKFGKKFIRRKKSPGKFAVHFDRINLSGNKGNEVICFVERFWSGRSEPFKFLIDVIQSIRDFNVIQSHQAGSLANIFDLRADFDLGTRTIGVGRNLNNRNVAAEPRPFGILRNGIRIDHRLGGIAGVSDRPSRQYYLPKQERRADYGDPEAPLCPKCAIFGSVSRLPLGAKVALILSFWIIAWGAIIEGLGYGPSRRRGFKLNWFVGGETVGLIPFLTGLI